MNGVGGDGGRNRENQGPARGECSGVFLATYLFSPLRWADGMAELLMLTFVVFVSGTRYALRSDAVAARLRGLQEANISDGLEAGRIYRVRLGDADRTWELGELCDSFDSTRRDA